MIEYKFQKYEIQDIRILLGSNHEIKALAEELLEKDYIRMNPIPNFKNTRNLYGLIVCENVGTFYFGERSHFETLSRNCLQLYNLNPNYHEIPAYKCAMYM